MCRGPLTHCCAGASGSSAFLMLPPAENTLLSRHHPGTWEQHLPAPGHCCKKNKRAVLGPSLSTRESRAWLCAGVPRLGQEHTLADVGNWSCSFAKTRRNLLKACETHVPLTIFTPFHTLHTQARGPICSATSLTPVPRARCPPLPAPPPHMHTLESFSLFNTSFKTTSHLLSLVQFLLPHFGHISHVAFACYLILH